MITVEDIDQILRAKKVIAANASWVSSKPNTARLKVALEIDKAIKSGLFLHCDTTTHTIKQHGSLVLVYHNKPIERMNVFPQNAHANKTLKSIPSKLRGVSFPIGQHRYYAWENNRRWPREKADNMDAANAIDQEFETYKEAVNYFLAKVRITGEILEPPHEPGFEFND